MDLFSPELIRVDRHFTDKRECLAEMVEMLVQAGIVTASEPFLNAVWEREIDLSTGIGRGIGIPHGRHECVQTLKTVVVRTEGIEFGALDEKPVQLVFLTAIPMDAADRYREVLGRLSGFLHSEENRQRLLSAPGVHNVYEVLKEVGV